ncbi:MAG: restriction endonuclease [Cellulomonadaceae bacterium]|nr:restriction endonuclease [Cellulomonadaceae bacterium]
MQHLGESDAEVTRFTGDGGIDVGSAHYVAQVKNYAGTVGVAAIRELFGVASAEGRSPAFFTSGTYSADAMSFASRIEMPLFVYDAINGTLAGATPAAQRLLTTGL